MKKNKLLLSIVLFLAVVFVPNRGALAQGETPHIFDTTLPVDPDVKAAVDVWLASSAPLPLPYWAITYVGDNTTGGIFVSLVALNLSDPDAIWHITDSETVAWMGSVIVNADASVYLYSDGGQGEQSSAIKFARPSIEAGGGSNIRFPWEAGATMMYGPSGVHAAGGGGAYAAGFSAVDFLGGDDLGSGVATNKAYAVATGSVDYVCADDTSTLVRTENTTTNDYYIYAHLLANANLTEGHAFSQGALIGSLKYGSFDDNCGYAAQTAKHYHLHFGFKPANNAFRMEGCILSLVTSKWTCGTETISTGQFLKGGGGGESNTGDDAGISSTQPSFWDYILSGTVSIWDKLVVQNLPPHKTLEYTYVIYNTVKLMVRIGRVMVYSNINLGHLMAVLLIGINIRLILGTAELAVFIAKVWKTLIPYQ
jgi:hypothetical protein